MKTPAAIKITTSAPSSAKFIGTTKPRHLCTIDTLLCSPATSEHLDRVAGASNGPHIIFELRRLGLEVPCIRSIAVDRDGSICRPGIYVLTAADREKLRQWKSNQAN